MKQYTIILSSLIIAFTLTAFTYSNLKKRSYNEVGCQSVVKNESPVFNYGISSYCMNTISKERLNNITSIAELVPDAGIQEDLMNNVLTARDVMVKIMDEKTGEIKQATSKKNGTILSNESIKLLNNATYATVFSFEGVFTKNDFVNDINAGRQFDYCMTVVPEKEAQYPSGNEGFIDYLKSSCQHTIAKIHKGDLRSGMIEFTVGKDGTLSNIELLSSCGYPSVDERMISLMHNLPRKWEAAHNEKGEKVEQNLIFTFGQAGC